jgi:hypothetical protein
LENDVGVDEEISLFGQIDRVARARTGGDEDPLRFDRLGHHLSLVEHLDCASVGKPRRTKTGGDVVALVLLGQDPVLVLDHFIDAQLQIVNGDVPGRC